MLKKGKKKKKHHEILIGARSYISEFSYQVDFERSQISGAQRYNKITFQLHALMKSEITLFLISWKLFRNHESLRMIEINVMNAPCRICFE